MRKQTKVVAVASAAALLAIGASMTSFAATGWVEEDGTWYFYDKDGNRVEDEWKKSGDNWYWLDSEEGGAMAVDKLVDDDDDTYYVDSNGVMVRNTWVKVVNEDQDDEDDPAEYNYYYMQSNGKAYKASSNTTSTRLKTIDGKRYAFDEDGKMLYGWVNGDAERMTDEDDWANVDADVYYMGEWDDGAMKIGWQKITVHDEDEDDDMDYWFYFKSNGKRFYNDAPANNVKEKKINGKKYGFDARGVMVYEWMVASGASVSSSTASDWKYFSDPEDGARKTKGWFKVVGPNEDNTLNSETYGGSFAWKDSDDEEERWYYADGDGNLAEGEIKKIKGKYYGFRPDDDRDSTGVLRGKGAAMLSGLVMMQVDSEGKIVDVLDDDVDADELDDFLDGTTAVPSGYSLYYFGNDADSDGSMKTGSTTVNLDGDSYSFYFSKTGGAEGKGKGVTGIDDEKYIYQYGCKLKADSDEKYIVVYADGDTGSGTANAYEVDSADIRNNNVTSAEYDNACTLTTTTRVNKDNETVKRITGLAPTGSAANTYFLVNTSGSIVKNKTAARDGDDWYFYVDDKEIRMYTNNKTLPDEFKNWK